MPHQGKPDWLDFSTDIHEQPLESMGRLYGKLADIDFTFLFRAPAVIDAGPSVEILAEYHLTPDEQAQQGRESVAVAVRDQHLLATAFHPELTSDLRW